MLTSRTRWIFAALALLPLAGCSAADSLGLKIDLSQLNWQTGAVIAIAYMANSRGHLATVGKIAQKILNGTGLFRMSDEQRAPLEELGKKFAELFNQAKGHPEIQEKLLDLMAVTASVQAPVTASKVQSNG